MKIYRFNRAKSVAFMIVFSGRVHHITLRRGWPSYQSHHLSKLK